MFGLFRQKVPSRPPHPDDQTKAGLANAIAALLGIQLLLLPPEHKKIEDDNGHIYRKSIGYVYGYVDAFLRMKGYDMADSEIGIPITFHVLRKLFPDHDTVRYMEFLAASLQDETVHIGMMHGGQQCLDYSKPKVKGAPMGLFRFILEDGALQAA
jgi:hypothetical protein